MKQVLQEQLPKFSQVNPELEAKTTLLKSDPALYQLYNDLVVSRLISAEEFWANRFSEGKASTAAGNGGVKGQTAKPGEEQQEIGLPSAFLVKNYCAVGYCYSPLGQLKLFTSWHDVEGGGGLPLLESSCSKGTAALLSDNHTGAQLST